MSRNAPPTYRPSKAPGNLAGLDATRVRLALDAALEAWQQQGRLPSPALLRDGLFLLQAGHTLEDAQVSLLLRAALAEHKGMVTALRHQPDAERTALLLADALLAPPPGALTLAELEQLRREDEGSGGWLAALPAALHEETSSADAGRRARALALSTALESGQPAAPSAVDAYALIEVNDWPLPAQEPAPRRGLAWLWAALLLVLLAGLALAGLWWMQQARWENMVLIPAGVYTVSAAAAGGEGAVEVAAFALDRYEVTIGDYRRCLNRGRCPQPGSTAGATRPNYLLDPAFERFPVVNVDWQAAEAYCAFAGKRLPSAVEWEIAAGHAPGSARPNSYPWGEQFQLQRANSARTGLGDAQEVGSYRPSGDSALGAADLAGNVAEWTSTTVGRAESGVEDRFLVKGGSYRDEPAELLITFSTPRAASFFAPWLGFRCAVDREQ
jgi:formylglycine-generating enzyme required for sulfatase activity